MGLLARNKGGLEMENDLGKCYSGPQPEEVTTDERRTALR